MTKPAIGFRLSAAGDQAAGHGATPSTTDDAPTLKRTFIADLRPGWHETSPTYLTLYPQSEPPAKPDGHLRIRVTLELPEHHLPVDAVVAATSERTP